MLMAFSVSASDMREKTDSWLQGDSRAGRPSIGGGTEDDGETPNAPGPVGDTAWILIAGLGLTYGVYVFGKNRRSVKE